MELGPNGVGRGLARPSSHGRRNVSIQRRSKVFVSGGSKKFGNFFCPPSRGAKKNFRTFCSPHSQKPCCAAVLKRYGARGTTDGRGRDLPRSVPTPSARNFTRLPSSLLFSGKDGSLFID